MKMFKTLAAIIFAVALPCLAQAQTAPNLTFDEVLTPAQWTVLFAGKQDYLGAPPLLSTGGTLTGPLITAAAFTGGAGLNLPPGAAPTSPNNGDLWATSGGLFVQINGTTVGPLSSAAAGSFAATSPVTVGFGGGLTTYACPTCGVIGSPLSQFASTTSAQLAGIISDESGSGALLFGTSPTIASPTFSGTFAGTYTIAGTPTLSGTFAGNPTFSGTNTFSGALNFTGLGTSGACANSLVATSAGLVFKGACPGAASSIQPGATTVTGGTSGSVEFNNAGTLGEVAPGNGLSIASSILGLTPARRTLPTIQTFTTGSGTYTTPTNVLWIEVYLVGGGSGGGGGGNGSGSTPGGASCWNTSGSACTTPLSQAGGGLGSTDVSSGNGGTPSGVCNLISVTGGQGTPGLISVVAGSGLFAGGAGGSSFLGGGATSDFPGPANSGAGGGGGNVGNGSVSQAGWGGAAGGTCGFIIQSPVSSYTWTVGTGGAGLGAAGAGGSGKIWVVEHYGS